MAAPSYTTTEMLARIKRTAQLAAANLMLTDAEILQVADEAIQSRLWPILRRSVEGYGLREAFVEYPAATTELPDSSIQRLPSRASSSTLSLVSMVQAGSDIVLSRILAEEAIGFGSYRSGNLVTGIPASFCLFGDYLRIYPAQSGAVTLRLLYERRPSRLIAVSDCADITSTDVLTSTVEVTSIPTGFDAPGLYDFVRASPQATDPICDDASLTLVTPTTTLEFDFSTTGITADEVFAQTSAGDYVCPAGYTCVFPLPDVWWPVAIAIAASDCLTQCGFYGEAAAMAGSIETQTQLALDHSANRIRKQPNVVFNRQSPRRTNRYTRLGWGYY